MALELEILLDQTRDALISGNFADLADIASVVERLSTSLPPLDRPTAERLRRKADQNARLLQAANRGIRAARHRLDEISSGTSLATYDAHGRRALLPCWSGPQPKRV